MGSDTFDETSRPKEHFVTKEYVCNICNPGSCTLKVIGVSSAPQPMYCMHPGGVAYWEQKEPIKLKHKCMSCLLEYEVELGKYEGCPNPTCFKQEWETKWPIVNTN